MRLRIKRNNGRPGYFIRGHRSHFFRYMLANTGEWNQPKFLNQANSFKWSFTLHLHYFPSFILDLYPQLKPDVMLCFAIIIIYLFIYLFFAFKAFEWRIHFIKEEIFAGCNFRLKLYFNPKSLIFDTSWNVLSFFWHISGN